MWEKCQEQLKDSSLIFLLCSGNDPEAQRYAGEAEDHQKDAFHGENQKKFKDKNSDCKCICMSLLCFMALILAVAFGLFVALFYLGSLDKFREPKEVSGTSKWTFSRIAWN